MLGVCYSLYDWNQRLILHTIFSLVRLPTDTTYISYLPCINQEGKNTLFQLYTDNSVIRLLFVDYLFQLHRPHQDIATVSYVIMTSYLIDISYRAVKNNYNQLVTYLESFQAITIVFVFWYSNWESLLGSMTS